MDIAILVIPQTLTDKSVVWNVRVGEAGPDIAATSEDDAIELADKIKAAIDEHSVTVCEIIVESWRA